MTTDSRIRSNSSPSTSTEPTTRTETGHYSERTNKNQERDPRATRSNASHLGIPIRGCGPASGRPEPALHAVDLAPIPFKIISMGGWSPWC